MKFSNSFVYMNIIFSQTIVADTVKRDDSFEHV